MWLCSALLLLSTVLCIPRTVSGLGSSCSAPLGSGTASSTDPYWLETIKHQGTSPFNSDPNSYQIFRNVKDFGAKGDGVTDDTAAIKLVLDNLASAFIDIRVHSAAMSSGTRCGGGSCAESTYEHLLLARFATDSKTVVSLRQSTYLVSSPINTYYYTEMIGDAKNPPSLLARSNFSGFAVIDADPYIPNGWGAQWFANQDNFFRSVRNLIIDMRQIPSRNSAIGLHWQVAQATSLVNVVVEMSTASGTNHQGKQRNGDYLHELNLLTFRAGKIGIQVGNQQFTVRNLIINNANVAVSAIWNWGFTFQGVTINNCQIGFDLNVGGATQAKQGVGSETIIDAVVTNTPVFVRSSVASNGTLPYSLVLNNIQLTNVPTAVGVGNGGYHPRRSAGRIFGKARPQYADYATSQIISVKSQGAKGDGRTDDTAAIQNVFNQYAGCKIIFFDAGVYYVTDTITIPAGTQIVGEAWTVILGGGSNFQSQTNPRVVVQAGTPGSQGIMEISGILFSTAGPAPGAIVLEWNVHDPSGQQGAAGLWDTHIRSLGSGEVRVVLPENTAPTDKVYLAKGTNMQEANCPAGSVNTPCQAAFLGIHLTSGSSAYFEGTWVWTADHDFDAIGSPQTSIFTGRGILSESAGPVWFIGTSEHASLYQYNLVNAQNHYIGFAQTENPYYQPVPAAPAPYNSSSTYHDPTFSDSVNMAWAMNVQSSSNIILFGAGFYTFYQHYGQTCLTNNSCQTHIFNIDSASSVTVYSVSTVGSTYQLSVGQNGVVSQTDNQDGFQSTFTAWSN
ncbi:glycoside hydrolase family 55 protein [Boletus reticuloceps]|uniref:Glycoside hydrolase family 55 protein n=1 Tax=Boletus reticuloceps TaxID=495285 RepID=A0A8I2YJ09_9AGAM|nr:glycoside hydrolase family 55 protein [Boletus reticuloceps]